MTPTAADDARAGPALEFRNVSKVYRHGLLNRRKVEALRGVSFAVQRGETFALLGPNRAGKTTLVKILLSLCQPSGGECQRLGKPVAERSTLGRIGFMHENHAFPRYLSAAELLHFYGALTLVPEDLVRERVPQLLKRVDLADRSNEPIGNFSKGMIQRLGLAQPLLNDPDLLVLDEPTEGLDLNGRRLLREVTAELRQAGKTVLLISHVLAEVEQMCDRMAVLAAGRLVRVGRLDEVKGDAPNFEAVLQELYNKGAR